jgi:hypothetical protein
MVMVVTMMVQRSHYPVIVGQLAFSSQLLSIAFYMGAAADRSSQRSAMRAELN